jgi:Reverse transcriptase (RNA-dependent DNA polymerase)
LVLAWFTSYRQGRAQAVCINGQSSKTVLCSTGVPQGSCLGALIFSTYVSPLYRFIEDTGASHHSYADDFFLYVEIRFSSNADDVHCSVVPSLTAIHNWYMHYVMLMNTSKTDVMTFSTKRGYVSPKTMTIDGVDLPCSDHLTVLGVTLDEPQSIKMLVTKTIQACKCHLRALYHIKSSLGAELCATVARVIALSKLDYCNSLLYGITEDSFGDSNEFRTH